MAAVGSPHMLHYAVHLTQGLLSGGPTATTSSLGAWCCAGPSRGLCVWSAHWRPRPWSLEGGDSRDMGHLRAEDPDLPGAAPRRPLSGGCTVPTEVARPLRVLGNSQKGCACLKTSATGKIKDVGWQGSHQFQVLLFPVSNAASHSMQKPANV